MSEKTFCSYVEAWKGPCGVPAPDGAYCSLHAQKKCVSCGQQASHECPATMQLVCGAPLCPACTHNYETNRHEPREKPKPESQLKLHKHQHKKLDTSYFNASLQAEMVKSVQRLHENTIRQVLSDLLGREPTFEDALRCRKEYVADFSAYKLYYDEQELGTVKNEFADLKISVTFYPHKNFR